MSVVFNVIDCFNIVWVNNVAAACVPAVLYAFGGYCLISVLDTLNWHADWLLLNKKSDDVKLSTLLLF